MAATNRNWHTRGLTVRFLAHATSQDFTRSRDGCRYTMSGKLRAIRLCPRQRCIAGDDPGDDLKTLVSGCIRDFIRRVVGRLLVALATIRSRLPVLPGTAVKVTGHRRKSYRAPPYTLPGTAVNGRSIVTENRRSPGGFIRQKCSPAFVFLATQMMGQYRIAGRFVGGFH